VGGDSKLAKGER